MNLIKIGNEIVNLDLMTQAGMAAGVLTIIFGAPGPEGGFQEHHYRGKEAEAVWSHLSGSALDLTPDASGFAFARKLDDMARQNRSTPEQS